MELFGWPQVLVSVVLFPMCAQANRLSLLCTRKKTVCWARTSTLYFARPADRCGSPPRKVSRSFLLTHCPAAGTLSTTLVSTDLKTSDLDRSLKTTTEIYGSEVRVAV